MPLETGQIINERYRIVTELGQGGFGAVYRAWDINLNKPCAVKENLATAPEAQRQFKREASVLANLTHPNLPRVIDHFSLPGEGQYLVMDFVDGEDLATVVEREKSVSTEKALNWINQVADALIYMHKQKQAVIHRDIKPANIRLTPDGNAMLVDFGLVKFYDPSQRTTMGARAITPGYAPPEQYGHGRTDARTDIYALGATLYILLTGQEPLESVIRVTGKVLLPVHNIKPSIPAHIGKAIEKAMSLEPDQRFQNVAEFKAAINDSAKSSADATMVVRPPKYQPQTQPSIKPPPVQAPPLRPPPPPVPAPSVRPQASPSYDHRISPQPKRKNRALYTIFGLLLVAAVSILGVWYLAGNGGTEDKPPANLQATIAAGAQATSTAQAWATVTAITQLNADEGWELAFGPLTGSLEHNPEDGRLKANIAPVDLNNFVAEATFINPYAASTGSWDYGFMFRHAGSNQQFRLVILSDKSWLLRNNTGTTDGEIVEQGEFTDLDISDGGTNHIKLVCDGADGTLFINDIQVTELDLSARTNSGDVIITTGILSGNQIQGSFTEYQNFTIWALP